MAKKLSGKVGYADPFYDFSGPMFNLYPTAREETDAERIIRLNNREITMRDAPSFTPDMEDQNYLRVASKASALGIPMPAPTGPNRTYSLQQAADFIAAHPMPNRLGDQVLSPPEALALRIRQAQAASMIPGSANILSPRNFSPGMQESSYLGGRDVEPSFLNRLRAMLGY